MLSPLIKKAEEAVQIANKINFRTKFITMEKNHIMKIRESIQREVITVLMFMCLTRASKYMKQN